MKYSNSVACIVCSVAMLLMSGCGGKGSSPASVSGIISGLNGGTVDLQINGTDTLAVTNNGSFSFGLGLSGGSPYNVTISSQPANQFCSVSNGSGTIDTNADAITTVVVSCGAFLNPSNEYVFGAVSGLTAGTTLSVQLNQTVDGTQEPVGAPLAVSNGSFYFPTPLTTVGESYAVTIAAQPAGQTCALTNASGTVVATGSLNPTVGITCSAN